MSFWVHVFLYALHKFLSESIESYLHIKARDSSHRKNQRVNLVKLSKIASHFIKYHRMPMGKKGFLLLKDINEDMKENYNLKIIIKMTDG